MGQSRVACDLCKRAPGSPHRSACARSKFQQARLGALLASMSAPRWRHVSSMIVTDVEIVEFGEHVLPANAPRSNAQQEVFFQLPGETYSRYPGRGGRARNPKLARFAFIVPRRQAA